MKNKIKYILFIILFLIINSSLVFAKPNYDIIISLLEKNVDVSDKISFSVDIKGNGICSEGNVHIMPEAIMGLEDMFYYYDNSLDPTKLKPIEISDIKKGSIGIEVSNIKKGLIEIASADEECETEYTKNTFLIFDKIFKDKINYIKIKGTLIFSEEARGGDYNINVILSCKSDNEWYTFKGNNQFHIRYKYENLQYIVVIVSLIVAALSLIVTIITIAIRN